jgi:hypothetical protein
MEQKKIIIFSQQCESLINVHFLWTITTNKQKTSYY